MEKEAEKIVSRFYNTIGWETIDGITEDSKRWEDLRECANEYVTKCRLRVLRHIPKSGEYMLDMASGPIQFDEYLKFSEGYKKRYCIDLSIKALQDAEKKIQNHGVFLHGSFFDISLEQNFFDCTISLHTIYHIDKVKQEEAVRKLVMVTKPDCPIIIVYSNPNSIILSVEAFKKSFLLFRIIDRMKRTSLWANISNKLRLFMNKRPDRMNYNKEEGLYYYLHDNDWWRRFEDVAEVRILPWRSLTSDVQKKLIPNNKLGRLIFKLLFYLEDQYPDFFATHFHYPMIILKKKK